MAKLLKQAIISSEPINLNQEIPCNTIDSQLEIQKAQTYQQGYLAAINETAELKQQITDLLASLPNAIAENRVQLSAEIADIVLLICQQIFIEQQNTEAILQLRIKQILTQINSKESIELYLHPQDINALQAGNIHLDTGLKITSDDTLRLGGCLIKTEHGLFDASIEKQIDRLKELLLQIRQGALNATLD